MPKNIKDLMYERETIYRNNQIKLTLSRSSS